MKLLFPPLEKGDGSLAKAAGGFARKIYSGLIKSPYPLSKKGVNDLNIKISYGAFSKRIIHGSDH
jgi:hypothetical protein